MDCTTAAPQAAAAVQGSLCLNCQVRTRCVGGAAAEAGTAQLKSLLAGRHSLQTWETLYAPDEAFQQVYVIRSGALKSTARRNGRDEVQGFHFPGEIVGLDGLADGRQRATVTALEETQVCAIRFAPRCSDAPGARGLLARLWDMMSCEMLRERAHRALLATLPARARVSAFLASAAARMRRHGLGAGGLPLAVRGIDVASYLGVPLETAELVLRPEGAVRH